MVKDGVPIIPQADYSADGGVIDRANEVYSRRMPRKEVLDLVSDGTSEIAVSALTGFDEEFSGDPVIEYPISTSGDPNTLERRSWNFYTKPAPVGLVIRMSITPPAGQAIRVTFKVPHSITDSGSTIKASDFQAFCKLVAAEACDDLSRHYTQTSERPQMGVDQAFFTSKSREYESRAKTLRRQFDEHIGVPEDGTPAASVTKNFDTKASDGRERITHPRRLR
jgi:hypothetical protein